MDVALTIKPPEWLVTPELEQLFSTLGANNALLVGGCVRNAVIGGEKTDVDIATSLIPEAIIEECNQKGFKTIPTGIEHGTVTAVINKIPFEITTLRKDIQTDGRRAQVEYSNDWHEDARRRDFTMNALYMDLKGSVYDPLQRGVKDLEARKVCFVGTPEKRIREDYLRILRFFRFYAEYGQGEIDSEGLKACKSAADKIETLSRERITQEFLKILQTDIVANVLSLMFENNILNDLSDDKYNSDTMSSLIKLQTEHSEINLMARLFVLAGNKPNLFEKYLRLSHAQMKFLIKLDMATDQKLYENEKALKKAIFHHGNGVLIQGYLLICAIDNKKADAKLFDILTNWQAPECPITGETLLAEGYQTGPELGIELNRRIEEWLENLI